MRHATDSSPIRTTVPHTGAAAARERWVVAHDPSLRERLQVAADHLRVARCAAGRGLADAMVRREVAQASREITIVRRALQSAQHASSRSHIPQTGMVEKVAQAAAALHHSTRSAARLLATPAAARR